MRSACCFPKHKAKSSTQTHQSSQARFSLHSSLTHSCTHLHTQAEVQQPILKTSFFQIYRLFHLIPHCNFIRSSILSKENRFRNKKSFYFLKFPIPTKVFFFSKTNQPTSQTSCSRVSVIWCLIPDLMNVQFIIPVPCDPCDMSQLCKNWKFHWDEEKNSSHSSVKVTVGISAGSYIIFYR